MRNLWQMGVWAWVILIALLGMLGCENSLESIKDRRILRIGISKSLPPFSYVDSKGDVAGFEVLLGKKLAKDLLGDENRVRFHAATEEQAYNLLQSNKLDIVLANYFNLTHKPDIALSATYMHTSISVLGRANEPKGIQELAESTVLVRKDSVAAMYFQANYPTIALRFCLDLRECLDMFASAKMYFADIDAIITPLSRQNPNFTISVPALGDPYPIQPLLKRNNTSLKQWLDKEIMILHQEGFLQQAFASVLQIHYDEIDLRNHHNIDSNRMSTNTRKAGD